MRSACALNSRYRSLRSLVLQEISTIARRKCCYHLVYTASRRLLFELRVSEAPSGAFAYLYLETVKKVITFIF